MKTSILFSIALVFASSGVFSSCGNDNNNNDEPDAIGEITRVKDGNGKVFVENSKMVVANTSFSAVDVRDALAATKWTRQYDLFYDNKHVSGKFSLTDAQFPVALVDGNKVSYSNGTSRSYSLSGRTLTIAADPMSSTYRPVDSYSVVALDYSGELKRIITDKSAAGFTQLPEGYDYKTTCIRTVWVGE